MQILKVVTRKQLLIVAGLIVLGVSVRVLTFQFMRAHLNDAGWFQFGSYAVFDREARSILDGTQNIFFISDSSRTDRAQYPPAFPAWVAVVYKLSGNYSAYSVQTVQWFLDLIISSVLIIGIAVTAFGWRTAAWAALLAALSPLLALYAAYPSADTPTAWFVLAGNWFLLLAAKRNSVWYALGAGLLLGVACWLRVNPLYLCVGWSVVLLLVVKASWKRRVILSGAILAGTLAVISPIIIRNLLSFPDFTPTGGTIGVNLWEGLGETELGRQNGFQFGDHKLVEHERSKMGLPADFPLQLQWPDGIRRDRARVKESFDFIKQHPIWYAGVMLHRMWGMVKVFGKPLPYYGTSGINVTPQKCLPPNWQGGVIAIGVKALGMFQSVSRYLLLPVVVAGIAFALRRNMGFTLLLLVTIVYYLVPGTFGHAEIRYMIPVHALLVVFGGEGVHQLVSLVRARKS